MPKKFYETDTSSTLRYSVLVSGLRKQGC